MKKIVALLLGILFIFSVVACQKTETETKSADTKTEAAPTKLVFTLPTGSMGGSYYNSGTAMAQVFNSHVEGMEMSVSASNSQDNVGMLENGEVDFAMASGSDYVVVFEKNPKESTKIYSMGVFNENASVIIVKGNSSYTSLADLKGKKIQMGASGSGQYLLNKALIETLGLTTVDFAAEYMSQSDGTQAFIEGKVEANMIASGLPSSLITQISASDPDFKVLTWDDDFLNKLVTD